MDKAIGSEDLEKALLLASSGNAAEAAKGIATAAGIEKESIVFYSKQAQKFSGSEMQAFFNFLVKQEQGHLLAIKSLMESLEKRGKWLNPALGRAEKPKIFSKKDWDKENLEGLTAVLFALWKEKQAQEFYEKMSQKILDKGAKQFFKALAEFEKGHAALLSEYAEDSYYTKELIMG